MRHPSKVLYWTEIAAAAVSACLLALTLAEPQWIELLFDEAPDGGDGSLERWIVVACSTVTMLLFARLARREKRKLASLG